ncbi:MAG TPA: serine hydrolase [Verrucomicrobiae bacterium]|nr:serine hydrolase [Verrucomicrobiae bacterium]
MRRTFRLVFAIPIALLIVLLLTSSGAAAQDLQSKLDQYMQASVKVNHFMGSVLVAQHGKILFAKGYGMANIKDRIPNASDTEFRVGSVTKEFTATAILKLQSEGKLNVQDPVCKYVPNCPVDWHPIKIFHLLTHTSGIPDFTNFPNYLKIDTKPITPAQLLADFKDKPLDFKPGAKFRYSNSGYEVLGYIIERVSGETYQRFLQQNIFGPLEMKESGYDSSHPTAKNHAIGYVYAQTSFKPADYVDMTVPYSAGALYSTVQDLYTWDRALQAGKLLPKPLLDQMFAPQVSTGGTADSHYGFGWFISTAYGHKEYSHEGGIQGFTCLNSWFPEQDAYVIVLDNMQSAAIGTIARQLAAILFGQKYELPKAREAITLPPQELQKFAGQYQINPHLMLTITLADGQLNLQSSGRPSLPIFPESKTEFFLKVADAQISFVLNPQGKATGLILHQGGQDMLGKKVN